MQLLIFYLIQRQLNLAHKEPSLAGGGLKWTRTIDLTLIRRVL